MNLQGQKFVKEEFMIREASSFLLGRKPKILELGHMLIKCHIHKLELARQKS